MHITGGLQKQVKTGHERKVKLGCLTKALLTPTVVFINLLIVVEGAKTPAGLAGQVRPR